MTCRQFTDFLADHFDGKLPKDVSVEFDEHLSECPDCVTYLRNYGETIRLTRESDEDVPADVPRELVDAIVSARQKGA